MIKNAVIFDLDGTLLDTLDDLADSGNHTLAEFGCPTYPVALFKEFVGEGVRVLIEKMLPADRRDEATIEEVGAVYRNEYGQRWNAKTRPYDGVEAMLDALTVDGVKMGVLSNKPDVFTQKCVAGLLDRWTFDPVFGHGNGIPRKPDPAGAVRIADGWGLAPEQIVYVGDTGTDMETGKAAGMWTVGVLWGFRGEDELRTAGADVIIDHPRQLLEHLGS